MAETSSFNSAGDSAVSTPSSVSRPTLRTGSRGDSVRLLQTLLNRAGYELAVDGIFGTMTDGCALTDGEALPVEQPEEGPAVIRSNVSGDAVKEYTVEILKKIPDVSDGRELVLSVTDPELIAATGGIVQGMVVSYNRDNSGEKPLRRKALRACRIGAPVRCRRGQYGTTPFLQTG